jgi:hypothetical protein
MAVIHISEAEAAKDFPALMVRGGAEVVIENGSKSIAVLRPVESDRPCIILRDAIASAETVPSPSEGRPVRLLSESLRILKERGSSVILDGDFGRDLEAAINSHPESLQNPWE